MTVDPQERSIWRSGVRSASNLEGGRLMWIMYLLVIKNLIMIYDDDVVC